MKKVLSICLILVMCLSLTACKDEKLTKEDYMKLAESKAKSNAKTVVMKITKGDVTYDVTLDMMTYFLAYNEKTGNDLYEQNKEMYSNIYSENVSFWEIPSDNNIPMAEEYKKAVFSTAVYSFLMYYEAKESNISLTKERQEKLDFTTDKFLSKYTDEEKARCGMTKEVIRGCYEKLFLADQYNEILSGAVTVDKDKVKASVDKEMYRIYETEYLFVSKNRRDADMNIIEMTEQEKEEQRRMVNETFEKAKSGTDFVELQKEHNDVMTYSTRDFQKSGTASFDPEYVNKILDMNVNEIQLLELDYGYYIMKVDSNDKIYGYEDAVTEALDKATSEAISDIYVQIEKKYNVETTEAWDKIEMGTVLKAKKSK